MFFASCTVAVRRATIRSRVAATDNLFGLQKNEKQTVLCAATSGTFTLSFRGVTTVPISAADRADIMSQKINVRASVVERLQARG
ncbi:hypothetical protein PINS_up017330 [Pythium insidiosum]|nr:hypothetical protein PINS_up017330 [Pythium insidiosum]